MAIENFVFTALKADTEIKPFKCEDKDLNGFLMDDAKKYQADLMAVTYLIENREGSETVAYFSLLNDKISYDPRNHTSWNRLNRLVANSKRRKHYPAVKIGRLAISEKYRRIGLGEDIIDMVKFIFTQKSRAGCRFITVDAYPNAVGFYTKCGFEYFSGKDLDEKTIPLFYDLKRFDDKGKRNDYPLR